MKIDSKFDNDEKVITHLGDSGVVSGFHVDDCGNLKVNVDLPAGESGWFKETQLTKQ